MDRLQVTDTVDYKARFETAAEAQLILDTRARIINASDHYVHAIGRSRDDVIGHSLYDLPPYAGNAESSARLRQALQAMSGAALQLGAVHLTETAGTPALWKHATLQGIFGANRTVEFVAHVLQRSASRERSESDSERRLRKLVEQTYDAIVLFDAHSRPAYVSPAIERVLGFTEREFAERNSFEGIHPDDRARFGQQIAQLTAEPGGLLLTHVRAEHRDGSFRMLESAIVNRLHDPDLAAMVSTFRDVTEQVELQEKLRRSESRLRVALQSAHAISWDWGVAENRGTFSSDVGEFFGGQRTGHEAVDAPLFVHPEDRARLIEAWQRCIETGEPFKLEYRGPLIENQVPRHYAAHGQRVRDASGKPERVIGVTWDVTDRVQFVEERRLLEQRMQESQKLESLGVLAGGIAHDFNNLLMVILGNVSLLQRELGASHPSLALEQIEEASRRATDLCRQLLAYAGKGRFVLERTSINQLIEDTTHLLRVSISKKAVLLLRLDAELPPIVVDVTQIRQVLMNLVMNASDAIGQRSGTITITTGLVRADRGYLDATFMAPDIPAGEYVYLEISDTGSGMSAETQARIFEPFFTTKFTGRGLGLAAVLGIVRGHKGALKVYSEVGKGSSFKLLLPAALGVVEALAREPTQQQPFAAGGTILVVDDEPAVRSVASNLLRDLGFRTLLAQDGGEALAVYREHAPEIVCVLMDLTMPGLDGKETLRELRRIRSDARVLLMSGYNEQEAVAGFVGGGVAGFIQKPFTLTDLEQRLRNLLG